MDRALKERIIGAVVLVLFVVLVVPVFLDGRSGDGEIISERVPLPGQSDQDTQTIVLDRDREDPVPVATRIDDAETAPEPKAVARKTPPPKPKATPKVQAKQEPAPAAAEPQQESQPTPAPRIVTASATGMWAVQLGSFGNQENAERLAADLRKQGFAAFLSQLTNDGTKLHRVRIGPQKDRNSAEAMAERLARAGHSGQVVPHP